MLKYFAGAILLLLSVYAGYLFSYKYLQRLRFFQNFSDFNKRLSSAVSFSSRAVNSVIREKPDGEFSELLYEYKFGKDKTVKEPRYLTSNERVFFKNYAEAIGSSDKTSQMSYIEEIDKLVTEKLIGCEADYKKYKPIYIKLGFLFGLILFVLIL